MATPPKFKRLTANEALAINALVDGLIEDALRRLKLGLNAPYTYDLSNEYLKQVINRQRFRTETLSSCTWQLLSRGPGVVLSHRDHGVALIIEDLSKVNLTPEQSKAYLNTLEQHAA